MILKSLISFTISMLLMPQVHGGDRDIIMSSKINKDQRKTLKNDLEVIRNFSFAHSADPRTLTIMELDDLNSDSAYNWLRDRVSAVIEDTDLDKLNIRGRAFSDYPRNEAAVIEQSLPAPSDGSGGRGVTVMSNIGTAIYYAGKTSNQLYSVKVKTGFLSSKKIEVTSPRSGIIQIGEGLFMRKYLMNKDNEGATSNSLGRMAVFFHEARHSDGNGKGLGFFHAVCPIGHDFAGAHACDRNLNGPYSVGAQMMKEMARNCDDCSVAEKEQMRLRYLDSMNRVLPRTIKILDNVDDEVTNIKLQLDSQKMLYQVELMTGKPTRATYNKIVELEKKLNETAIANQAVDYIPSVDLDPRAERVSL